MAFFNLDDLPKIHLQHHLLSCLGNCTLAWAKLLSRRDENSPESILATRNHSRLDEMMSPGRIMQKTSVIRQFM